MNFQAYFLTRRSDYVFLRSYQMFFHCILIPQRLDGSSGDYLVHALLKAGSARAGYIVSSPAGFKYLYERRAAQLLWATRASVETTSQEKENLYLNGISCASVFPIASCPVNGQQGKELKSIGSLSSHQDLSILIRPLQTLLFFRLSIPTYLNLSS